MNHFSKVKSTCSHRFSGLSLHIFHHFSWSNPQFPKLSANFSRWKQCPTHLLLTRPGGRPGQQLRGASGGAGAGALLPAPLGRWVDVRRGCGGAGREKWGIFGAARDLVFGDSLGLSGFFWRLERDFGSWSRIWECISKKEGNFGMTHWFQIITHTFLPGWFQFFFVFGVFCQQLGISPGKNGESLPSNMDTNFSVDFRHQKAGEFWSS